MTLMIMDADFNLCGELPLFSSLQLTRSAWECGSFEVHVHPDTPGADQLQQDRIIWPAGQTHKAMLIEDVTRTETEVTASGCQLKGLVNRRICVPPVTLPTHLWTYTMGQWVEVTDEAEKRMVLKESDVYEGYTRPAEPTSGMYWVDMTDLATVYSWGQTQGTGSVWYDLATAHLRSKYQDFGYDAVTGPAETAIKHYIGANCIAPEDSKRVIPHLTLEADAGRGITLPWHARFESLDSVLASIGEATTMGWDIVPDLKTKTMIVRCAPGTDHTTGAQIVILSTRMGNATEVKLAQTASGRYTTAYVGGTGEDENRLILAVESDPAGLNRRETFVDGGSLDDPAMMEALGTSKLEDQAPGVTLTASVQDHGGCRYERDWDLGDWVLIETRGAYSRQQVTAVKETYERGKARAVEPTFGDGVVTLGKRLRSRGGLIR